MTDETNATPPTPATPEATSDTPPTITGQGRPVAGTSATAAADGPVLVTAGHGKTGRRVVARLEAAGVPVRVGSRSATPPFDWYDDATWAPALAGTSAAYMALVPDCGLPGSSAIVGAFARAALREGVRRLVFLSGRGEPEAEACERALQGSGADWTVLRASWFAQDFSEHFLHGPVMGGVVALPAADVAEPFVDVEDIADVAAAALTSPDGTHVGRTYELTGPACSRSPRPWAWWRRRSGGT